MKRKKTLESKISPVKAKGWMEYKANQCYGVQLSKNSEIFLLKEGKTWTVWRGYWMKGKSKPIRQKTIIDKVSFNYALARANNYIYYITNIYKEKR